ncbi:iron-sulfur cluster assembly scaffold protein [Patescibacteria group bacterium]|nr:MAG: iron-sulfur cluster assembly scaffold protein [Patescibacteria group bacterium]
MPGNEKSAEVENPATKERWVYSEIVKDHFFHPRNLLLEEPREGQFDAEGVVGSPACGDVMRVWIKVNRETERIIDFKWKTFGCGSAIASSSMFSAMATENGGLTVDQALKIRPQDVMERLGGLPARKIHCSVLIDKAFKKAADDWFRVTGQHERIFSESGRVVDSRLNITDHDIEEAVLEGARTLEEVQKKLKVGVGDPVAIPAIEQLIRFYSEKYYG